MTSSMPPGWYPAQGDPPGTNRYWDGEAWQGDPQPVGGVGPQPYTAFGASYHEKSQATTALILSIGGLVCCGVLAPIGWKIGQDELNAIDAGRRDPGNRGSANAARIIGIIGTAFLVLGVLGFLFVVMLGAAAP